MQFQVMYSCISMFPGIQFLHENELILPSSLIVQDSYISISCEFGLNTVKLQYHMFSSMKIEEYMESELPGIFKSNSLPKI